MANAAPRFSPKLEAKILSEFGGDARALKLCGEFATQADPTDPLFFSQTLDFIRTARGESGDSWAVRRLAALMLERQIAFAIRRMSDQVDSILVALGFKVVGTDCVDPHLL